MNPGEFLVPTRTGAALLAVALLFVVAARGVAGANGSPMPAGLAFHSPILIEGDANFTSKNGVVGGRGTTADPYVIAGWNISAASTNGIVVRDTRAAFVIRDVSVRSGGVGYSGIVLENATQAGVVNASIENNANGIVLRSCADAQLLRNEVSHSVWDGIAVFGTRDLLLTGNNVTYNRDGVYMQGSSNIRFLGNAVWLNAQDGTFVTNMTNLAIQTGAFAANGWVGIHVNDARTVNVLANSVFSNGRGGINVEGSDGLNLRSNSVLSNQGAGVQLTRVQNASVFQNEVSSNRDSGVNVASSQGVDVRDNIVTSSGYGGVVFGSVSNATVEGNAISHGGYGVALLLDSHVAIRDNNITQNSADGIYLAGSKNVSMVRNNDSYNTVGITLESSTNSSILDNVFAFNRYGVSLVRSVGIVVTNNSMLFNSVQASDDLGPENRWDAGYPAGGNYWSNYFGFDRCHGPAQDICSGPDGIGDVPYFIDTNSQDRYPLVRPPWIHRLVPKASFVIRPAQGDPTTVFTFDATLSDDFADRPPALLLRWDFDNDGSWDTNWTTSRMAQHRYAQPGTYTVRLQVQDSRGRTNDSLEVVTVNAPSTGGGDFSALGLLAGGAALAGATVLAGVYLLRRRARRRHARAVPPLDWPPKGP